MVSARLKEYLQSVSATGVFEIRPGRFELGMVYTKLD